MKLDVFKVVCVCPEMENVQMNTEKHARKALYMQSKQSKIERGMIDMLVVCRLASEFLAG